MKRIKLVVFFILGLFMLTSCSMFSHESFPSGPQIEEPGTNPDVEVSSYLITYYENGLKVHQESLESGKALPQVESTKAPIGQEFMGWSTSKEEYVPVDFDVMPESDVDLYAFYQKVKYTITFNANINLPDGTTTTKEYEYHERLGEFVPSDLQEIIDAQTEYVFVGWFLDPEFKEEFVEVSMPAEDIVLYAKWQFSGIRFMNGLEVFYEVKDDEGASVQAPLQNPTKPGYDFVGWVDAKGNAVSFPLTVTDEVQFIYAAFEAKNNITYKVEHYLENLNGTFVRQEVEELFGSTDSEVEALWKSYTGFSKDETNENNVLKGIVNYNGTLVLKLYYSRNSYKVSFETNGGSAIQAVSYKYEQMVAAPSSPNKLGYTFAGWELNGESYSFTNMPAHDIELSAKWQVVEYTVTFVTNELVGKVTYTVENKNITEPAVPSIEHFTGAWEEYELTTGNITVKAVYTPVTYTVTFKAEGVTVDTENYTVVNPTINEPSVPTKEHYTGAWESYVLVGGNVEVEAVYTPVTYYVTFVAEGTEVAKLPYTVENKTVVNPAVPTKAHYTGVWESYTLTSGNVEVEAVYTPVTYYVTFVAEGTEVAKLPYTVENKAVVNPAVPTKAHYTGVWESYTLTSGNVEVEAVYTPVTYYVTFVAEGTEVAKLPYTVENKAVVNPAVPAKAHYTGVWETYTLTSGNVEVEAIYTPVTYTVTFKDGDSLIGSDTYTVVDTIITEPALPTKAHYTSSWAAYVLDGGNKEVQVVYTPVTYYVTFVAEGTEVAKLPYTVENTAIVEPAVPAKTGYTAAWESYSVVNGNITVNAVYTIISYEINWDLSGGNLSTYTCTDREVIANEFLKDMNNFYNASYVSVASYWETNRTEFWKDSEMRAKWIWIWYEIKDLAKAQGQDTKYIDDLIAGDAYSGYALQNVMIYLLQINNSTWVSDYQSQYGGLASRFTTVDATEATYEMELQIILPDKYTVNDAISLPTPTRLGYEFLGWYVEGNKVTEISKGSTGDKNLLAMWKIEEYALSWELDGGLLPQYTCTDRETIAQEFLKDMNNFYNASYESVASYWKTNRTDFWKDSEMRAKWLWIWDEIRDLAIAQSQDTKYIDDLIAGTAYSGYALQNVMIYFLQINNSIWVSNYQSQYGGLASRFTTVDATEANYEMELPVSLSDIYTVNDVINLPILTKKGYSFLGWYIEGNKVTEIAKGSTGNKVLVAMWKVNEYEIQYEVNGGTQPVNGIDYSDATLKDNITITDYLTYQSSTGAEVALHNKVPAKYWGYITLKETEFSNVYTIVQIVSGSANITKDYDLVIMWHSGCTDTATKTMLDNILKNSSSYIGDYVVLSNVPGASTSTCDIKASIYNKNEVVITKAPQYKYQEGVEYILPVPSKEHYTFAGWYTNPEFTGEKLTVIDNATTGNVKLYAKWTPVEYTVTFKSEVAEDIVKTYTVDNTTIEEPTVPTKAHYTGVWESYTLTSGNVEVEAVYTPVTYTVTFKDGDSVIGSDTYTIVDTNITEPALPTKTHYTSAWAAYVLDGGNKEVQVVYTPVTYYVTFVAEGTEVAKLPYTVENTAIAEPTVPAKTGYTAAWESYSVVNGNITVNAVYTIINYVITFKADGEIVESINYTIENNTIAEPTVPSKTGYTGLWEDYSLYGENTVVNAIYYENGYSSEFESAESFKATTSYNNTSEIAFGPSGKQWKTYYGTASTTSALVGSQSMQMRWYSSDPSNLGYIYTNFTIYGVNTITFKAANTNKLNVTVYYSIDEGKTWIGGQLFELTTTATTYTYTIDPNIAQNVRIKFQLTLPATKPGSTSRVYIDSINASFMSQTDIDQAQANQLFEQIELEEIYAENFTLPSIDGVTWSIGETSYAELNGNNVIVTLPSAGSNDAVVEFTATCTINGNEYKKTYSVTIPSADETPEPEITDATIPQLKALVEDYKAAYYITGTVSSIMNTTYGNFYLEDENSNSIYVYGATATTTALTWNGLLNVYEYTNPIDYGTNSTTKAILSGDVVQLLVVKTNYQGTPQLNAIVLSVTPHEHDFVNGSCSKCGTKDPNYVPTTQTLIADFASMAASHSAYTDSWKYDSFTIYGGANNSGKWGYVKMGGKSSNLAKANPVYISTTNAVDFEVSTVTIKLVAGSLPKSGMKVNSWGLYVYDSEGNQVDYVAGGTITSSAESFVFTPTSGDTWSNGYTYKVEFDLANTSTTNGIIWIESVTISS